MDEPESAGIWPRITPVTARTYAPGESVHVYLAAGGAGADYVNADGRELWRRRQMYLRKRRRPSVLNTRNAGRNAYLGRRFVAFRVCRELTLLRSIES